MRFKRARPGDAITARLFNELLESLEQALATSGAPPVVVQRDATGTRIALAPGFGQIKRGTLDGGLSYGGSAVCSILSGAPGSESDSGENITVYDGLLTAGDNPIDAGSRVFIAQVNGYWWVIAVACPL